MSAETFLAARDLLLRLRDDYVVAREQFRWPQLEQFNWALHYFDTMARSNDRVALHIVDEDSREEFVTFAQLRDRSNRVANFLRSEGVGRGDRIMVMLGNVVPLWEVSLAAMKLGAVFSPATSMLTTDDLQDRIDRGGIRHVVCDAAATGKFAEVTGIRARIVVGQAAGWVPYSGEAPPEFDPQAVTNASDPMLLYFTSGTTAKPKMVLHTHASYPVGHLSTMYWIGLRAGDLHWNISSPGWAKHAWSSFFAPWNAGATVFIFNYARFDAKKVLKCWHGTA